MSAPRLLALTAAAGLLSACLTPPPTPVGKADAPRTPTELWRAEVTQQPHEIRLAVRGDGLSPAQMEALSDFAEGWRANGGPIVLRAPVGGPESASVGRASEHVRGFLLNAGVPTGEISVMGYEARGDARAPLILARQQYAVTVPACGRSWTNVAHSRTNEVQANFGCATTANMAAQIANPADLLGPAAVGPPDAQRREVVLDKYRKGEVTASAKDEQAAGAVAEAGK